MSASRFVVGIDLGTTNCALAYVDTGLGDAARCQTLPVPQVVNQGVVEDRQLLPSFLYLPGSSEQPAGSLSLPWDAKRDYAVGEFARNFGSQVPTRLVSSAKSWLCHSGVNRRDAILPWKAPEDGQNVIVIRLGRLVRRWPGLRPNARRIQVLRHEAKILGGHFGETAHAQHAAQNQCRAERGFHGQQAAAANGSEAPALGR